MSITDGTSHTHPKVIYILGFARSGTTILGNVMAATEGAVFVGELMRLWRRLVINEPDRRRCGCGEPLESCEFWKRVFARVMDLEAEQGNGHGDDLHAFAARAYDLQRALEQKIFRVRRASRSAETIGAYRSIFRHLYQAIAEISGARVIVDSSKEPWHATHMAELHEFEPAFVHIVRDPRGALSSRQRKIAPVANRSQKLIKRYLLRDAMDWIATNRACQRLMRATGCPLPAVQYEMFATYPYATVQDVLNATQLNGVPNPVTPDGHVLLSQNHSACGNRNRFTSGKTAIRLDESWRRNVRPFDMNLITALTAPVLGRFGYALSWKRVAAEPNAHLSLNEQ